MCMPREVIFIIIRQAYSDRLVWYTPDNPASQPNVKSVANWLTE